MTDRPILFSGPMVRAMLDGSKTQTRRVVKTPTAAPEDDPHHWIASGGRRRLEGRVEYEFTCWPHDKAVTEWRPCPYGQVGDRLWVRETWKPHSTFAGRKPRDIPESNIFYQADDSYAPSNTPWKPGIHMPRWASRLTLEVTDVRVERLQDISEADAMAEGIHRIWPEGHISDDGPNHYTINLDGFNANAPTAAEVYRMLWEWINGPDSWTANPWVWAISFEVVK